MAATGQAGDEGLYSASADSRLWRVAQRYWGFAFGLGVVLALSAAAFISTRQPLWYDELYSYYIAVLPSFGDVWKALLTTIEAQPPLFFATQRASIAIFGPGAFALRLPELIGVAVAAICVYLFAARRVPRPHAAAATAFLLATKAFRFTFEARPYGLLLGFSALALVAWQRAVESERVLPRIGVAMCLCAAVYSHYYAVVLLGPLWLGEAIRWRVRRRADPVMAAALIVPILSLVFAIPQLRAAMSYAVTFWGKAEWIGAVEFYRFLLYPALFGIVGGAVVVCALARPESRQSFLRSVPAYEWAVVVGIALLPFPTIVAAKLTTGAFLDRYILPAVLGLCILLSWGLARIADERAAIAVAMVLLGSAVALTALYAREASRARVDLQRACDYYSAIDPALPIAVGDPQLFLQLSYYAPPSLAHRLLYLADRRIALRRTGTDNSEAALITLRPWARLGVLSYRDAPPHFLVIGRPDPFNWLVAQLRDDGREVTVRAARLDSYVFDVHAAR